MEVQVNEIKVSNKEIEPALLTIKEMCKYLGIGDSTARKMLSEPNCPFVFKMRNRKFANKKMLDKWIAQNTGR